MAFLSDLARFAVARDAPCLVDGLMADGAALIRPFCKSDDAVKPITPNGTDWCADWLINIGAMHQTELEHINGYTYGFATRHGFRFFGQLAETPHDGRRHFRRQGRGTRGVGPGGRPGAFR